MRRFTAAIILLALLSLNAHARSGYGIEASGYALWVPIFAGLAAGNAWGARAGWAAALCGLALVAMYPVFFTALSGAVIILAIFPLWLAIPQLLLIGWLLVRYWT